MPPHQGIRSNKGIQFQQGFAPYRLRFPCQQRPLSIGELNTLATQSLLQQAILGLEELNDDLLTPVNPARNDHQQECEQRSHGTHAKRLPQTSFGFLDALHREIVAAVQAPEVKSRFDDALVTPGTGTPENFTAFLKAEAARWSQLVKTVGIEVD